MYARVQAPFRSPIITLKDDTLSITFPEIAGQVRSIVERQFQKVAAELPPTWSRADLVAEIESSQNFPKLSPAEQETARTKVRTWTPAHVEGWLREFALNRGGLSTDAFTALTIKFQRTTRLPDDGQTYSPPSAWGQLPLRSVDDFAETAPAAWLRKGGVIMPLARSEALWIWFPSRYRFATKIGAGKLDALSGEPWSSDLQRQPQKYLVAPGPPWSENAEVLRRYVALPPGTDDAVNALRADRADAGGIQFQVVPLRAESYYDEERGFFLPRTGITQKPSMRRKLTHHRLRNTVQPYERRWPLKRECSRKRR